MRRGALFCVLACLAVGCGDKGSPQYRGTPPPAASAFGTCAFCHPVEAAQVLPSASELNCVTCHAEQRPGFVGPGHRALPPASLVPSFPPSGHDLGMFAAQGSCSYCHAATAREVQEFAPDLRCANCHQRQLAPAFGPGHRSLPDQTVVPSAASPPHAPAALAYWGKCALCHAQQASALAAGFGESPATACTTCHQEASGVPFGPGHATKPGRATVPDPASDPHRPDAEASWGDCALCHNRPARSLESLLGPAAELTCATCHLPGSNTGFGPGHRLTPQADLVPDPQPDPHAPSQGAAFGECALCHRALASAVEPVAASLSCEVCHAPNVPGFYGPRHRLLPSPSLVPAFLGADHQLGERAPFGSCAFCHSDKVDAVRNNGGADLGCLLCHEREQGPFGPGHRSIPPPSQVPSFVGTAHGDPTLRAFGSCAFCHRSKTDQALQFRHGNLALDCDRCHLARQDAAFGPGHATVTPCSACHGSERQTHHDPQEGTPYACAICHDPHGSENLFLIARLFRTPSGELRALRFDNLGGLADGGFASVSEPGTGLCETCHEKTRFFRFDGSGEPHFAFPCFTCHPHRLGFSVRP